jgi:hypothetical protein
MKRKANTNDTGRRTSQRIKPSPQNAQESSHYSGKDSSKNVKITKEHQLPYWF